LEVSEETLLNDNTSTIYRRLRESILSGQVPAGSQLSQVQLALQYGVSRGPVREALRMLQRDGLIEAELNRRVRVSAISFEDLEQLYALRIVTESMALRAGVDRFTEADLAPMKLALGEMDLLAGGDIELWEKPHRRFHQGLISYGGDRILGQCEQWFEHSERYRRIYFGTDRRINDWQEGARQHREIFDSCVQRQPQIAAQLLARHLARTALSVLTLLSPEYEPGLLRAAVRAAGLAPDAGGRGAERERTAR
jgi:DNA-binding GntR family transcriptional regulator